MKITLRQDEIELAIRDYVLTRIAVREDQELSVNLSATRGQAGYTATIDIHVAGSQPAPVTKPRAKAANTASAKTPAASTRPKVVDVEVVRPPRHL